MARGTGVGETTEQIYYEKIHITPSLKKEVIFMRVRDDDKQVVKERKRLLALYKDIPKDRLQVAEGLIIQAARLRIMLDYMWEDLQQNGEYDLFQQSDKAPPYERERPVARLYNTRDQSYQRIIKQLSDLLPKKDDEPDKIVRRDLL